ncbi:hypothetical protein JRQ81_001502, partial [Phrynocephalus forsythii]
KDPTYWVISNFSEIAAPLTDLTHRKHPEKVEWVSACQQSFDALKEVLMTGPVLVVPNYYLEFTLFENS